MKRHFDFLFFFLFFLSTPIRERVRNSNIYIYKYKLLRCHTLTPLCVYKKRASAPMWQKEVQP